MALMAGGNCSDPARVWFQLMDIDGDSRTQHITYTLRCLCICIICICIYIYIYIICLYIVYILIVPLEFESYLNNYRDRMVNSKQQADDITIQ